jgi:hypothetical protein
MKDITYNITANGNYPSDGGIQQGGEKAYGYIIENPTGTVKIQVSIDGTTWIDQVSTTDAATGKIDIPVQHMMRINVASHSTNHDVKIRQEI